MPYKRTVSCALLAALMLLASGAAAEDRVKADALFREGRTALDSGDWNRACELFEQSLAEDPSASGTLLNLGYCREKLGDHYKAYRAYAAAARQLSSPEKRAFAERSMAEVARKLPHVRFDASMPSTTRVQRDDGSFVDDPTQPFPVEPGRRTLTLLEPGQESRTVALDVPRSAGVVVVVVTPEGVTSRPSGADAQASVFLRGPRTEPTEPSSSRRTLGIASIGLGLFAIGLGTYFGLKSFSIRDSACASTDCDVAGLERIYGSATTTAMVSTASFGIGITGVIGGALLVFVK